MSDFIDVHAHVNFAAFDADRDTVIKRALDAGVFVINVGTQQDTSRFAIETAEKYERGVYAIIGLHPIHTGKSYHDTKELGEGGKEFTSRGEVFDMSAYRTMAEHPKVVGIGECGLDYYRENEDSGFKIQEEVFRKHIELALDVKKPLMLHVRNGSGRSAYKDALAILKSYNLNLKSTPCDFHFFAGGWEEAKEVLDAGFNLSFTGVITFARNYDEVIKNTPLDRIMSETDCPYVTPTPFRGKRNEPLHVREVAKKIAEIRGESFEIVKKQLVTNASRFFGLSH
ncbi:MAG: Mg-dependent DNAse [Candidatus Magasanikbacteria bacterium GW2011_GWA2_46_17]|uniref:Mg-dependent DNAse n=1 Tax=Candidatus Magasanikbacteria bacterium GW2011_GWA2_46_17 TaxID=1619042 RepID=A0A0G1P249_9BACT|nr:MAG: Mg-dependent DNAse [Candidatus Magasanikbacteria bacterium GW2011_GWA2_46_17]